MDDIELAEALKEAADQCDYWWDEHYGVDTVATDIYWLGPLVDGSHKRIYKQDAHLVQHYIDLIEEHT